MTTPALVWAQPHTLSVEIRCDCGSIQVGDEIPITFVVSNAGTTPYPYTHRTYDRSGRMGEYRLDVYDEQGRLISDPRTTSLVPQGYVGGGLGTPLELEPGQRFSTTVSLNLWASIAGPGVYTVRGTYALERGNTVMAPPLTIRVLARSPEDMGRYIEGLAQELLNASSTDARTNAIRRLMYTADRRAVAPLLSIATQDNNTTFWIGEAFSYYLPKDGDVLIEAIAVMRQAGLSPSSLRILEQLQAPRSTIADLIETSLTHAHDAARSEAVSAAQRYPDDRFMPRLIELASRGTAETRVRAIYALAANRTDAGIAALRALRSDADSAVRHATEQAIRNAYRAPTGRGRPLLATDFPDLAPR